MTEPLLSIGDVAGRLQLGRRTVERLIAEKRIRVVRIGRRVLVEQRELDAFVASRRRAA
jgi:excisionase family DNA binding protein